MKRLIVTDTHLGLYSDADAWLNIVLDFYKHIVKYCLKNDITQIIHLGDFFDNRKSLNTKTQHITHRIEKILSVSENLHTYIIVGNHDCYYKNKIQPNTLEIFKKSGNIKIIDKITLLDDILLVPWGEVPTKEDRGISPHLAKYCFGHFAINGFHMNDSYRCKTGLDIVRFKDFEKVLSGHFHTPSSNHNIFYLGAPYGQTFHDAGGTRGYHIFDDGKLSFIEYEDAPKFLKIHTESDFGEDIRGNIIKLKFDKDYGTTKNQDIIDDLLKFEPFLYSVDFVNIESEEPTDDENIEMDSKEQIANQYIDKQTFSANINVASLKAMFMKLLKEAGEGQTKIKITDGTKIECMEIGFQNFLSFGSKWQDVPLHNGVNFVTGFDVDKGKSNGAGKSSFLETIPFALFGKVARDIKQDQIVNWKNKKNCQVVFRFKINEDMYEINRALKPNKLEIFKNGELMDQDAHKKDYQSMFENIFGMDVKMFMSLVHTNTNSSANIMSMKKAEKRKFLERMFGLEIYSEMNKLSNEKLRSIEQSKYKLDTDINAADDKIESAKKMKNQFNEEINSKKESIEEADEIKEKLDKLKENSPTLDDDLEETLTTIQDKEKNFSKITLKFEKWKAKLDAEVDMLKREIKKIDDQEEQRKRNKELTAKKNKIIRKSGSVDEITSFIDEKEKQVESDEIKIEGSNKRYSDIEKMITECNVNLKNVEKNLELLAEGICPVCGQDVTDPKTHYKNEVTDFKGNITKLTKKLHEEGNVGSILINTNRETKEDIKNYRVQKDLILRYESQIKDIGTEKEKEELFTDKENKIKKIENANTLYQEKKTKNKDEIQALQSKYQDLLADQTMINVVERSHELAVEKSKEVAKHIDSLGRMIVEQIELIEKTEDDIKISKGRQLVLNDIVDYLNAIKTILKDENIKQFTIKQIMPFLNKQTNFYLSEVNYGFYVSIDKWLDVEVKGPGIRGASYDSLSGGERRGIDIAIQLSLLDIARTQAGLFPDILIFDELLDSSIDGVGINSLMKIVRTKQNEFGGKIFIITHRPEIDSEMMDHEYTVIKQNGFSKVEL